ncbi:MAG: hypothetical protein VYD19_03025, partial [Myxococcota bacterium]|nr:hypothetical protein [Myxococcota bacterium]
LRTLPSNWRLSSIERSHHHPSMERGPQGGSRWRLTPDDQRWFAEFLILGQSISAWVSEGDWVEAAAERDRERLKPWQYAARSEVKSIAWPWLSVDLEIEAMITLEAAFGAKRLESTPNHRVVHALSECISGWSGVRTRLQRVRLQLGMRELLLSLYESVPLQRETRQRRHGHYIRPLFTPASVNVLGWLSLRAPVERETPVQRLEQLRLDRCDFVDPSLFSLLLDVPSTLSVWRPFPWPAALEEVAGESHGWALLTLKRGPLGLSPSFQSWRWQSTRSLESARPPLPESEQVKVSQRESRWHQPRAALDRWVQHHKIAPSASLWSYSRAAQPPPVPAQLKREPQRWFLLSLSLSKLSVELAREGSGWAELFVELSRLGASLSLTGEREPGWWGWRGTLHQESTNQPLLRP